MTYVDGYVLAVPNAKRAAYQKISEDQPLYSRNTVRSNWLNVGVMMFLTAS